MLDLIKYAQQVRFSYLHNSYFFPLVRKKNRHVAANQPSSCYDNLISHFCLIMQYINGRDRNGFFNPRDFRDKLCSPRGNNYCIRAYFCDKLRRNLFPQNNIRP